MKSEMTSAGYRARLHIGEDVYTIDDDTRSDPIVRKCTVTGIFGSRGFTNVDVSLWPNATIKPEDSDFVRDRGPRELFTHGEVMEALHADGSFDPLMQTGLASIDEIIEDPLLNRNIMLNKLGAISVERICHDRSERNCF